MRDVWLRYQAHRITGDVLDVTLADDTHSLTAHLVCCVHEPWDLVERSVVLENGGPAAVRSEQALMGAAHTPWPVSYRLTHLTGRWREETQRQCQEMALGSMVLESRGVHTSHHNPRIAIDSGHADESQGEVWYAALPWSGNRRGHNACR